MNLLPLIIAISVLAQMPNGGFLRSMSCQLQSVKIPNNGSITAYNSQLPAGSCTGTGNSQTRICKNAVLSGTYPYTNCTNGCTTAYWGSVSSGTSFTRYSTSAPYPGSTCAGSSQTYTCNNGSMPTPAFPYTYTYTTCADPCEAQTVTWTVGGATCSYTTSSGYQSGSTGTLTDSTAPTTGSATATCADGTVVLSNTTCVSSTCASGGVKVGGFCWYLGGVAQSCATVCSTAARGGYNSATQTYAGNSPSSNKNNCNAIFDALGVAGTSTSTSNCTAGGVFDGLGCAKLQSTGRAWCSLTAATSGASETSTQRVCACNN